MRVEDVPQDNNRTYQGHGTKAVYALDGQGRYTRTTTSGWDVEEVVLRDVLSEFALQAADAKARVLAHQTSPIEYFLYVRMMDLPSLAQLMGIAKWRVKRHFRPDVFLRLNDRLLNRYAEIFRIPGGHLKNFKENCTIDADS